MLVDLIRQLTCTMPSKQSLPVAATLPFQVRIRKSAFFDAVRRHGCHAFGVYNRTYISLGFHDPITEYWDLLNGVVLWPVAGERQVEIRGPDAQAFVELLTPRDLSSCAVGQCKYVLVTADDGGVVNDPICLKLADDHYWLSAADSDLWLYARGINALAGMDVTISDPNVAVLQVQGPRSVDVMVDLIGEEVRSLRYYWCREATIAGAPCVVSRTGWSSEWGYEIYLKEPGFGDTLFEHILHVGERHGIKLGVVSQIRRIEGGMLSYGADMGLSDNPYDLGLGRLVNLDKQAEFIGRSALKAIAERGPTRRLLGVGIDGEPINGFIEPWALHNRRGEIGKVTSLAYSPRLQRNIGLVIVAQRDADIGAEVVLQTPDGPRQGVLCALPFVPRRAVAAPALASRR